MYNTRMLFADAQKGGVPHEQPEKIWKALGTYVDECLRMGKGLKIPKLGSFTSMKPSVNDPHAHRFRFQVSPSFGRAYGVPQKKMGFDLLAPCFEFNMAKLAQKSNVDKDSAQEAMVVLVRCIGKAVAAGQPVRLLLDPVGTWVVKSNRDLGFRFDGGSTSPLRQAGSNSFLASSGLLGMSGGGKDDDEDEEAAANNPYLLSNRQQQQQQQQHPEEPSNNDDYGNNSNNGSSRGGGSGVGGGGGVGGGETGRYLDNMGQARLVGATGSTSALGWAQGKPGFNNHTGISSSKLNDTNNSGTSRVGGSGASGGGSGGGSGVDEEDYHGLSGSSAAAAMMSADPFAPVPVLSTARKQALGRSDTLAVFPRFVPQDVKDILQLRSSANTVNANLSNAFQRVEGRLKEEQQARVREAADIKARQRLTQQLFLERKARDASKQEQLVAFLEGQASEAQEKRVAERKGFHDLSTFDPGRTFPLEPPVNLPLEQRLKDGLRSALDEQVWLKDAGARHDRAMDMERDRFVLGVVQAEQDSDRAAVLAKRARERSMLSKSWEAQTAMGKHLASAALGKML